MAELEGDLREQVFLALGEASMCWSETPQGVFNDVHAKEIGERLIQFIENRRITSILDQSSIALSLAHIECAIDRLNTEVFATSITKDTTRQTLRGRVDELSNMAALGNLSNPWED